MAVRAVVLGQIADHLQDGLENVLREMLPDTELSTLTGGGGRLVGTLLRLAYQRPQIVVAEGFGPNMLPAAVYRALSPGSRLLLSVMRPPGRLGFMDRLLLGFADGVLIDADAVVQVVERLRFRPAQFHSFPFPPDLDLFNVCAWQRRGAAAHRLLYAGALTPEAGAADVLIALAAWAERNPSRMAEVWWAGEGDLAGVLEAQPLPGNLSQQFLGCVERHSLPAVFQDCGILIAPSLLSHDRPLIVEALAAGLVTLSSRRLGQARDVIRAGGPGWTFDSLRQDDLAHALSCALGSSTDDLDTMREAGRMFVRSTKAESLVDHVRDAIVAVTPSSRLAVNTVVP